MFSRSLISDPHSKQLNILSVLGDYVSTDGSWVWPDFIHCLGDWTNWLIHLCLLFHQNLHNILPRTEQKKNYILDDKVKLILLWKSVNNLTVLQSCSALCIELHVLRIQSLEIEVSKSVTILSCKCLVPELATFKTTKQMHWAWLKEFLQQCSFLIKPVTDFSATQSEEMFPF